MGRAPGWVGSDAEDWVAVDDWVLELAGCAAAREGPSMQTQSTRLKAR